MAFIMPHLTFLYTSFAKIFCQDKIKKNRKFIFKVFFKNTDIRCEIKTRDTEVFCLMSRKYVPHRQWWVSVAAICIYCYGNIYYSVIVIVNSSSRPRSL